MLLRTLNKLSIYKQKQTIVPRFFFSEQSSEETSSLLFNPYTKQLLSKRQYLKKDELITKLTMASVSFRKWKQVDLNSRVSLVQKFVDKILADKQMLKPIISAQIGKSYRNIDEEFSRIQRIYGKLIQSGKKCLRRQVIEKQAHKLKIVEYQPIGLSLIFPYFSEPIFDSLINIIPCLISGNGALIKASDFNHFLGPYLEKVSKQVFGRSALVADIFIKPDNLVDLAEFRAIKKVLFSGSQDSARTIFQTLIEKRFIDCNLFFGGKDAAYVDQTADLQFACKEIVKNSFYNNGQSYDCIKRLYLHKDIEEKFIELLVNEIGALNFGNPSDKDVDLGPLCVPENASQAEQLVNEAVSEGASCIIGGLASLDSEQKAVFLEPTFLTNCTNDMSIIHTQINAPILCAISVDKTEAFREINESDFGTGVRVFTHDPKRYEQYLPLLNLGKVSFNSGSLFDKNLPIEGWKKSGKGKLLSQLSYEEFSIPKSYNIKQL